MRAFSSPICRRWRRKVARTMWLKRVQHTTITGRQAKMSRVRGTFVRIRMTNEAAHFSTAIKNSSGQWWANSVTSNKSFVSRPIICPTLVLAK